MTAGGYGGLGALVAGDVNEDGKQDLIVGPVAGQQYDLVLLGNGDGTFTQGQVLMETYGFLNAQLVDINGDKHLDLVSGANGQDFIELGDGKGNFVNRSLPSTGALAYFNTGLAVGDFNGDGHPDLLTSEYNNLSLSLYSGNGDGTFQAPTAVKPNYLSTSGASLAAADFNGDGKLDFVLSEEYLVLILLGNGDGTFKTADHDLIGPNLPYVTVNDTASAPVVAAADMDLDGTPDLIAADSNASLLSLLLNDGTGTFQQAKPDFTAAVDPGTGQIRLADLNGDGLPDIVLTNYKTQKLSIFLSQIPVTTPTVTVTSSSAQTLVGSSVTLAVQVKASGTHTPTGTVSLAAGSTAYGQQTLDSNGQASFTLPNLAAGQYTFTAAYAGDKYNAAATNTASFSQAVTDFQIATASSTQSVAVGGSATYNVAITPVAGLSGTVSLTCTGLPSAYQCPAVTVDLKGQALTVPFVVSPATTTMAALAPEAEQTSRPRIALAGFGLVALCLSLSRRRRPMLLLALLAVVAASQLTGCGKSSGPAPYTGTSNFTITAAVTQGSVTVSHPISATLTVHQ